MESDAGFMEWRSTKREIPLFTLSVGRLFMARQHPKSPCFWIAQADVAEPPARHVGEGRDGWKDDPVTAPAQPCKTGAEVADRDQKDP